MHYRNILMLLLALPALGGWGMETRQLYVAPGGKDGNPGTIRQPLATPAGAREAIRALKRAGNYPAGGMTVNLRGGEYPLDGSFTLGAEDSGTADGPVVYQAYKNERVRLIGGRKIDGFVPVTDPAVLARLDPAARGKVLQVNLNAKGITEFGKFVSRGFSRPTMPAHLTLFFNGQEMTVARWPNEGSVKIAAIPPDTAQPDGHGKSIGTLEAGFYFEGDRPARWQQSGDIWVHGYWAWDWANSYERIEKLNPAMRLIHTAKPYGLYGFRAGQHYYFLNILEELDQPGEYYLDRATGILYFWPPATMKEAEIYVSLLAEPMVVLKDASHVLLRGLTLEYTRGHAVTISGGEGTLVERCAIRHIGNWAVRIEGGAGHGVRGCDIDHLGDGGILLQGGDRKTLTSAGHFADNNEIHHMGQWSKCYQPAVLIQGVGARVTHNLIHDGPHCGILLHGNDHLIEFNELHHLCLETGDVGAFYLGRDYTERGNVVRFNYFHHLGGIGLGSMAVYLDDCASGVTVYGNIFYQTQRAAFVGGGRDNVVENNIFVECQPAVAIDGRGLDKSPVWFTMVYETMRKRLEDMNYRQPPYSTRYPKLLELEPYYARAERTGIPPEGNVVARNVCRGGKWLDIYWHAKPEIVDIRDNLTDADPHFVDASKENFQLKDDSPAYARGFKRIPVEQIGLKR
ncbi:MAG: right-handed parallel beta-helix repeat-containing protein [Armatimonadota bacterium]